MTAPDRGVVTPKNALASTGPSTHGSVETQRESSVTRRASRPAETETTMSTVTTATLMRSVVSSITAICQAAAAGNIERLVSLLYTTRDVIGVLPRRERETATAQLRQTMRDLDATACPRIRRTTQIARTW